MKYKLNYSILILFTTYHVQKIKTSNLCRYQGLQREISNEQYIQEAKMLLQSGFNKSLKSFSINHNHLLIFTNKNSSSILSFLLRTNQSLFIVPKTSVDNLPAPCNQQMTVSRKYHCHSFLSKSSPALQNVVQTQCMVISGSVVSILTETKD